MCADATADSSSSLALVPELTLLENVALPLRLTGTGARESMERGRRQMEALGIASLPTSRSTSCREVRSSGRPSVEQWCTTVLRARRRTPGALDEENGRVVIDQLVEHAHRQQAGVVVVTHESWLAAHPPTVKSIEGDGYDLQIEWEAQQPPNDVGSARPQCRSVADRSRSCRFPAGRRSSIRRQPPG